MKIRRINVRTTDVPRAILPWESPLAFLPERQGFGSQGSTLVVTLVIAGVIGLTLLAYLSWSSTQNKLTARSQYWNAALVSAEAGIEEALTHLNYTPATHQTNGWTLSGTNYSRQRDFGDGYYVVQISTNEPPVITVQGYVRAPFQRSQYVCRIIRVTCRRAQGGGAAILARGTITISGSSTIDSFDSSNPLYSTGGRYDPAKREDHAQVEDNARTANCIQVGTGQIYGMVDTGPGGTVSIDNTTGSVGDSAWHAAGHTGIEPGQQSSDMSASFTNVPAPFIGGSLPFPPLSGAVLGTNYTYIFTGGNYQTTSFTIGGGQNAIVTGPTVLYCTSGFTISGSGYMRIASGASLKLFVNYGGTGITISGSGVFNDTGNAANLSVYGMTNLTTVTVSGSAAFVGTVYAPNASTTVSGSGGFYGACVSSNVTLSGGSGFHYDEGLGGVSGATYIANSWDEL